jgi:WD repeat-containing protein mio
MVQDNLDLAYLGVFSLWMEDIPESAMKVRTLGPGPSLSGGKKVSKTMEGLVRKLNLPVNRGTHTEYKLNRQLCLHVSGLSWLSTDLENWTNRLVQQGQHTKAAFVALVATDRMLVHKILRAKNAGQRERLLGVAIAGAAKRAKRRSTPTQSRKARSEDSETDTGSDVADDDENWSETIRALSTDLTDPYARAILAYVKSNDWSDVLKEDSLPLKYRVCVALRHLDDSKLNKYISQATKDAISEGDIEGVLLTGTGTREGFELMEKYVARFGDLQSAVLALATTVPRYVNEEPIVRKFDAWKQGYRGSMNSWGCRMERVRFDIAVQKVAVENGTGRRLVETGKPQVKLVCNYCAGSLAHHDTENGDAGGDGNGTKMHDTAKHPLTPANAAAIGTSCPRCGRKLPRCGVCDMWLGTEDPSYQNWYGGQKKGTDSAGSADLSGSAHTTIGPGQAKGKRTDSPAASATMAGSKKGSSGSADAKVRLSKKELDAIAGSAVEAEPREETEAGKVKKLDEMMARFTVFCVKCSHAFHAAHARLWFQGSGEGGRNGHKICPVPRCECACYE